METATPKSPLITATQLKRTQERLPFCSFLFYPLLYKEIQPSALTQSDNRHSSSVWVWWGQIQPQNPSRLWLPHGLSGLASATSSDGLFLVSTFHHQRQPPFVIYQRASTVSHLSPSQITGHISQIILRHRFLPCYFFVCRCLYDYWIKPRLLWGIQSIYGLSKCVSTNSNNIYHSSFLGSKERSPLSFICKATFAQGISRAYTRQPRKVVQVVHCTTSKGDIYI